jgi:oxygen-independent coproporphyrinogen-3 oxidase
MKTRHLYVHIPFCRCRCAYCDFASEPLDPLARAGTLERYVEALGQELVERPGVGGDAGRFETIYLGGGTPTVLPRDLLGGLVRGLAARLEEGGEFTVEANPGTIDVPLLTDLAEVGVTRLSLGVQSFAPALREALGRRVTQSEVGEALSAVATAGWREWNLDLVFGIPGQTWRMAEADLEAAVAAGPPHISLYDLTYTAAFAKRVEATLGAGARRAAGAVAERHYAEAVAHLEGAGYRRYEVSNFALPGHGCRHNLAYWRGEDYLGIGAGAVSTVGAERRTNPKTVEDYLAGRAPHVEPLADTTRLWEKAMLGLRTSGGVDEEEVRSVLDQVARDRLLAQGCLEKRYGKLRVNAGFLDVSNSVIAALLVNPGET